MQIKDFLVDYQRSVKPHYQSFFSFWTDESNKAGKLPQQMLDKFVDIYPRGKQLRGTLSMLGYQLCGGENTEEMLQASVSLELLETSVLIADDIFDKDDVRRGVPTIHKQWEKEINSKDLARDLTTIMAMNGYYFATHNLSRTNFDPSLIQKALEFYSYSGILTGIGEAMDIYTVHQDVSEKQSNTDTIHKYKTIWYSAILPLRFGAILAGADQKQQDLIQQYAHIVGSIFQIQDDILGSFGDPAITGKANTQDIREARWTILVELLYHELKSDKAAANDLNTLTKLLDQKQRSDVEIQSIKNLMKKYHAVDKAQQKAQTLLSEGLKLIPKLTQDNDLQDTLKNILHFVKDRQK